MRRPPGRRAILEAMIEPCRHKRIRSIVLFIEPTEPNQLRRAVIHIQCHVCGQPFEFVGVEGPGVTLSADRREMRVDISEASQWRVQ
jgi:hypothetical protein